MSRKWSLCLPCMLAGWLVAPTAWAGSMTVRIVEDDRGATIEVRNPDEPIESPRKVVTSEDGALFFFPRQTIDAARLDAHGDHRLKYVQVGSSRSRAAVRIEQRKRSQGSLSSFLKHEKVDGGFDIRIDDRRFPKHAPPKAEPEPAPAAATTAAERHTSLAALEARLLDETDAPPPAAPRAADAIAPRPSAPPAPGDDEAVAHAAAASTEVAEESDFLDAPRDDAAVATTDPPASRSPWAYLALACVGLLGGAAWWLRRRPQVRDTHGMEVVSRLTLAPRQQVMWIRAGSREFLLGATDQRIALLTELGAPSEGQAANPQLPAVREDPAQAKVAAFKARLQKALGQELRTTSYQTAEYAVVPADSTPADPDEELPEHLRTLATNAFRHFEDDAA